MNALADMLIRHMTAADLPAVVELDQLSFSDPWSFTAWREMFEDPHAQVWITTDGFKLVGALAVWLVLDELHIGTIAIHPAHQRQGLGARLLETGLRAGIARGVAQAHLEVRKSNLPAQRLYQRFGFEIVGERKRYYSDNREDAVLMSVYGLGDEYVRWLEGGREIQWKPPAGS